MAIPKLTLYVDVVSPFAYLAYYVTRHSPIFQKCEVTYIPISLGGLMKVCDNRPPGVIKNKNKWIDMERVRWAKVFNIPMTPDLPANFPPQTLHVERVLAALELSPSPSPSSSSSALLADALDALFLCFWVEGNADIGKPETFGPVLEKALGEEVAQKALREGRGDEAKKTLMENTQRAFESGAFGLPWWECVDGKGEIERFWGFDRMGQVVRFLGLVDDEVQQTGLMEGIRAML